VPGPEGRLGEESRSSHIDMDPKVVERLHVESTELVDVP
jgi:hypothetical protein